MKSFYEQRDDILKIIDSGGWKHSWHLPKNKRGDIDWFNLETHRKIVDVMLDKRRNVMFMLNLIDGIEIPPETDYD